MKGVLATKTSILTIKVHDVHDDKLGYEQKVKPHLLPTPKDSTDKASTQRTSHNSRFVFAIPKENPKLFQVAMHLLFGRQTRTLLKELQHVHC